MRAHFDTLRLGQTDGFQHQRRIAGMETAGNIGDVDDL
jgi:hypothetical protein